MQDKAIRESYQDTSLSASERAGSLVDRLTLEEKIRQMMDGAPAIDRLGVAQHHYWNECLHGVARAGKATVFPQVIGLAAAFNTDLHHRVAVAISDEARAKHHEAARRGNRGGYFGLTFWSPNINIFRDPRWGRGHETYGEDPYLTARLGVAFVKGLQGDHPRYLKLVATPKHFAVHSGPELERHRFDAIVSPRDLNETYLPAFKACIQEAKSASIMGAYNRINGRPCCASDLLLNDILRRRWGFTGFVVADCGAVYNLHAHHKTSPTASHAAADAVKSGCDMECGDQYHHLLQAVQDGLITEDEINIALTNIFTARFRLGMFDPPESVPYTKIPADIVNCESHRELACQAARESIVLLKNDKHLLPLDKGIRSVAVVGPLAFYPKMLLGNYNGLSPDMVTPVQGILDKLSPGTRVTWEPGCELTGGPELNTMKIGWSVSDADVIIAVLGFSPDLEGEVGEAEDSEGGGDRLRIDLPGRQQQLLEHLHDTGKPVVLVLTGGSPITINWAKEHISAIVMCWYPGEAGGHAVADVLFGDYNPAGRLPVTFPKSLDQLPVFSDYSMTGRTYRFMADEPLFRFGYGLSYTTFEYGRLSFSGTQITKNQALTVSVDVTNTGNLAGDEVVQLYISDLEASVPVPRRHLEGFKRIHLRSGETQSVEFTITSSQLAVYDDTGNPFIEPGEFRITIGGSQEEDGSGNVVSGVIHVIE